MLRGALLWALAANSFVFASFQGEKSAQEGNVLSAHLAEQENLASPGAVDGIDAPRALVSQVDVVATGGPPPESDSAAPSQPSPIVVTYTLPSWGVSGTSFTGVLTVTPESSRPRQTITYTLDPGPGSSAGFTGTVTFTPISTKTKTSSDTTPSPQVVTYTLPPAPGSSSGFTGILTVTPQNPPIHATSTSEPKSTVPVGPPKDTTTEASSVSSISVSFVTVTYTLPSGQDRSSTGVTYTVLTTLTGTACPSVLSATQPGPSSWASVSFNRTTLLTSSLQLTTNPGTAPPVSTTGFWSSLSITGVPNPVALSSISPPFTNLTSTPPLPMSTNGTFRPVPPPSTGTRPSTSANDTGSTLPVRSTQESSTPYGVQPSSGPESPLGTRTSLAASPPPTISFGGQPKSTDPPRPEIAKEASGRGNPVVPIISGEDIHDRSNAHTSIVRNPEFTFNFDDMPRLQKGNDILPVPIPDPYHGLWFSPNLSIVYPLNGLYKPSSGMSMAQFDVGNETSQDVPQIGVGPLKDDPCVSMNVQDLVMGCDSNGKDCAFTALALRWNGTANVVTGDQTFNIPGCNETANCTLQYVDLDSVDGDVFENLTSLGISASVDGKPVMWWIDDLQVAWESCDSNDGTR